MLSIILIFFLTLILSCFNETESNSDIPMDQNEVNTPIKKNNEKNEKLKKNRDYDNKESKESKNSHSSSDIDDNEDDEGYNEHSLNIEDDERYNEYALDTNRVVDENSLKATADLLKASLNKPLNHNKQVENTLKKGEINDKTDPSEKMDQPEKEEENNIIEITSKQSKLIETKREDINFSKKDNNFETAKEINKPEQKKDLERDKAKDISSLTKTFTTIIKQDNIDEMKKFRSYLDNLVKENRLSDEEANEVLVFPIFNLFEKLLKADSSKRKELYERAKKILNSLISIDKKEFPKLFIEAFESRNLAHALFFFAQNINFELIYYSKITISKTIFELACCFDLNQESKFLFDLILDSELEKFIKHKKQGTKQHLIDVEINTAINSVGTILYHNPKALYYLASAEYFQKELKRRRENRN